MPVQIVQYLKILYLSGRIQRRVKMEEIADELRKLVTIATDVELTADLRTNAIKQMGRIGSHDALRALLALAANDKMNRSERELALKQARDIIRSSR